MMAGSEKVRNWVVAGGGTGGHVTPLLALAEQIEERGDAVRVLGSTRGLETRLVPSAGFELVALPAKPVMGRSRAQRAASIPAMLRACVAAWSALRGFHTDVVVSVGGYASVPAVVAAVLRDIPVALVEPNAIPGRANLLATRFARRVFVQFDEAATVFERRGGRGRVRNLGIPLRRDLVRAFESSAPRRDAGNPLRLFVFGGSQGARQINEAMIEATPFLDPNAVEIFHQTGEADRERVASAYRAAKISAEVVAFENDMPSRYRWADIALCRAGALTVAELGMAALPALLVPYPYAADDHQAANARALEAAGAAKVIDSQAIADGRIAASLRELCASGAAEELREMSARAAAFARPDAARCVIEECIARVLRTEQ
jgi:UDP-N-acetylglucosamine--N-acetylmuramyl-(pentapeptide) pyrophosphoryl-undecaprenol N-acetylglucosamine transferase